MTNESMVTMEEHYQTSLAELKALLDDDGFLTFVERQPGSFTETNKKAIRRLATILALFPVVPSKRPAGANRTGGNRGGGRAAKKSRGAGADQAGKGADANGRGQQAGGAKDSVDEWKPLNDIEVFDVEEETVEQVLAWQQHGDTTLFFQSRAEREYAEMWDAEANPATSLACLLVNTDKLNQEIASNHILWLFHMLMWYRVRELFVPGTGTRHFAMGVHQIETLRQQMQVICKRQDWPAEWDVDKTVAHIRDWAKIGSKIHILTGEFGLGCLFVLFAPLTEAFLLRKMTRSGPPHDAAMARLRGNGLPTFLEENHLNDYGEAVMSTLLRPFAQAKRTPAALTESA